MQVVEGQTANGKCSIRVRVHALPQQVAAALDDNEAIMSRTLADDSGRSHNSSIIYSPHILISQSFRSIWRDSFQIGDDRSQDIFQIEALNAGNDCSGRCKYVYTCCTTGRRPPLYTCKPKKKLKDGQRQSSSSPPYQEILVSTVEERSDAGRDPAGKPGVADSIENVRARVAQAMKDADNGMKAMLSKAWCLGPHHSGPNVLLASNTGAETAGLFAVPSASVVQLSKRAGKFFKI